MDLPDLAELEDTAELIYRHMQPSAQLQWPLLGERCGCRVWVKHENHNPTGAFKVRGGLVYLHRLTEREPQIRGLVTATRGNHGQSIAFAASRYGLQPVVVVPHGNSRDKNRAIAALGAELVVHGDDFEAAVSHARTLAAERKLHMMPSFHRDLVLGVASYALELFRAVPVLDRIYVPIGLGSGICGVAAAREALGLSTEIVGVVAAGADAYARSFVAGKVVATDSAQTFADGVAVREPNAQALDIITRFVARVVSVSDEEIAAAMQAYFNDTHNVVEGAAGAPLAALLQERAGNTGGNTALILSGANIDRDLYRELLRGGPAAS